MTIGAASGREYECQKPNFAIDFSSISSVVVFFDQSLNWPSSS